MIPQKLYIPTSSLNFKNIMSSESISPVVFYQRRNYGYKHFEKVCPNPLDNRIVLYDKCPIFEIVDEGLDNYPMVVEIDTRYIEEGVILEDNNVYYAEQTIYLTPFTTRFIFQNNTELRRTVSSTEPSIESKLVGLYKNCFVVKPSDVKTLKWSNSTVLNDAENSDISPYISKDIKVNKLKGLMYGYLIAANKSTSEDIVLLKKYVKQLRNLISAILTSPERYPSSLQQSQLDEIYGQINDVLSRNFYLQIENIIARKSEEYKCDFKKIVENEFGWNYWVTVVSQKEKITSPFHFQPFDFSAFLREDKTELIDEYLYPLKREIAIREGENNKQISPDLLPVLQRFQITRKFDDKSEFVVKLLNEYAQECYSKNEFLQSRYDFSTPGVKLFKEEFGDKWEGSPAKKYLNDLRYNLNEYKPFNLTEIKNNTMLSFAAFCQKGESDIDKLESYLIDNGVSDFKVAFALWGVIFGFAEMSKTFTDDFYCSDKVYVEQIYKYIFNQLHGIDLGEVSFVTVNNPHQRWVDSNEILSKFPANDSTDFINAGKRENTVDKSNLGFVEINTSSEQEIPMVLSKWFTSEAFLKLNEQAQQFAKKESLGYLVEDVDDSYIERVQSINFPKVGRKLLCTQAVWKKCVSALRNLCEIDIFSANHFIVQLDSAQSIPPKVLNRLKDNWDFVISQTKDRNAQISFFINLCKKEGRGEMPRHRILTGFFTEDIAAKFEKEIREKYVQ